MLLTIVLVSLQAVAQCLLQRGRASVSELYSLLSSNSSVDFEWTAATAVSTKRLGDKGLRRAVTDALLTGVQHNFIGVYKDEKTSGDGKLMAHEAKSKTAEIQELCQYYVDIQRVLLRLRFSKFLLLTKGRFGDVGEAIVDEVLTEGRVTAPALLSAMQSRITDVKKTDVKSTFNALIRSGFVVEATNEYATPSREPSEEGKKHAEIMPDRVERPKTQFKAPSPSLLERATASASADTPELSLYAQDPGHGSSATKSRKRSHDGIAVAAEPARKRQKKALVADSAVGDDVDSSLSWCVNYFRFVRAFLEDSAVHFVSDKFDSNAGHLLRAIFGAVEPSGYLAIRTSSLSEPYIASLARLDGQFETVVPEQRIAEIAKLLSLPIERAQHYSDILARHEAKLLVLNQAPPGFRVNMPAIVTLCRRRLVESVVHQNYGGQSLRIFRLLAEKRMMEIKHVSERAMISSAETKQLLFRMLADGFVHMQPVPRGTGADPARTFYLWSVLWHEVEETVTQRLYGSMRRLRSRLAHTYQTFQHLHRKAEEEERLNLAVLGENEARMLEQAKIMEDRLFSTLLRLDDHALLLGSVSK